MVLTFPAGSPGLPEGRRWRWPTVQGLRCGVLRAARRPPPRLGIRVSVQVPEQQAWAKGPTAAARAAAAEQEWDTARTRAAAQEVAAAATEQRSEEGKESDDTDPPYSPSSSSSCDSEERWHRRLEENPEEVIQEYEDCMIEAAENRIREEMARETQKRIEDAREKIQEEVRQIWVRRRQSEEEQRQLELMRQLPPLPSSPSSGPASPLAEPAAAEQGTQTAGPGPSGQSALQMAAPPAPPQAQDEAGPSDQPPAAVAGPSGLVGQRPAPASRSARRRAAKASKEKPNPVREAVLTAPRGLRASALIREASPRTRSYLEHTRIGLNNLEKMDETELSEWLRTLPMRVASAVKRSANAKKPRLKSPRNEE